MNSSCLFYVHDPMCSWCYAFTQSWSALLRNLPETVEPIYLVGGLAPDSMEPMPVETQQMVQQAWRRIEQTVPGVCFNWEFWSRTTPIRSTYPACRAVLAAKKQRAEAEQEMIHAIQMAYYRQAKNPALMETLHQCAQVIGLHENTFAADLISKEIEQQLQQQIQRARRMNIASYPSLCLETDNALFSIAVDYLNYQSMLDAINRIIR